MSDVLRIQPRHPLNRPPAPVGMATLRRRLDRLDIFLRAATADLHQFAWADHDDVTVRLRALQQLEVDLMDIRDRTEQALFETRIGLELAADDWRGEREKLADLATAREARRASA